ncbi:MAG TPA: DUF2949 domain-containing protein [Stenomitos sp.]
MDDLRLIHYLQEELGLSDTALALVTRTQRVSSTELPIVLWNHGLIDIDQLNSIFDWLERSC